jgi:hypothetical protein
MGTDLYGGGLQTELDPEALQVIGSMRGEVGVQRGEQAI